MLALSIRTAYTALYRKCCLPKLCCFGVFFILYFIFFLSSSYIESSVRVRERRNKGKIGNSEIK